MRIMRIFFGLPLKKRHFMLDSGYYPRVVGEKAPNKSVTSEIDASQYAKAAAKEGAEPRKLPVDWQIGDAF